MTSPRLSLPVEAVTGSESTTPLTEDFAAFADETAAWAESSLPLAAESWAQRYATDCPDHCPTRRGGHAEGCPMHCDCYGDGIAP